MAWWSVLRGAAWWAARSPFYLINQYGRIKALQTVTYSGRPQPSLYPGPDLQRPAAHGATAANPHPHANPHPGPYGHPATHGHSHAYPHAYAPAHPFFTRNRRPLCYPRSPKLMLGLGAVVVLGSLVLLLVVRRRGM